MTSVVGSIASGSGPGAITVPDAALDPGVAVFDSSGELVAGSTPRSLGDDYDELAETPRTVVREAHGSSMVRAEPFTTSSGLRGVVVVTERLDPYEEAESLALLVSLVTGALATAATAGIAAWTVRRALGPVAAMAATASDWSEHDLGRRFGLGAPTNEISALAGTLDTLLDRVSSAVRSEQRLTSELAHELRTPLTSIQGTADLMVLARSEASVAAAASCALHDVVGEVVDQADPGGIVVTVDLVDARLALPHALAVRTLSPVVDNALHFARTAVRVSSRGVDGRLELRASDDGPGIAPVHAEDVFTPGRTTGTNGGAGLDLAISRRIARSAGGEVEVVPTEPTSPGGRLVIRLPLA